MTLTHRAGGILRGAARLAREHWLLALLLAAGLALRVAAGAAYRPALIYIDSLKYLYHSGGADPVGYRVLLWPAVTAGNLDLVAAIQHLLGLAMAVVLYAVLLRRGAPRWLSALAAAPILLDGYQLQIEQTIMPDVAFEALIVAGLAALLWRPWPGVGWIVAGGAILGASATVRQVGESLILPALVYVVAAGRGWRTRVGQSAALCAAFAVPILAYCTAALAVTGHFRLSYAGTDEVYGRLVTAVGCQPQRLPAAERPLCPTRQQAARLGIDGLEHNPASPLLRFHAHPPAGVTFSQAVSAFNRRLLLADPAAVAKAIGADALKLFAARRATSPGDTPISRWQFQDHYPLYPSALYSSSITRQVVAAAGQRFGGGGPAVAKPVAKFLRAYQLDGGYTPGPLLAFAVAAGLAGALSLLRRAGPAQADPVPTDDAQPGDAQPGAAQPSAAQPAAWRDAARACLLFFLAAATVLLASDLFQFTWRYQLPALVTLPPAAALGLTALAGARRAAHRARPAPGAEAVSSPMSRAGS